MRRLSDKATTIALIAAFVMLLAIILWPMPPKEVACASCGKLVEVGDNNFYDKDGQVVCFDCHWIHQLEIAQAEADAHHAQLVEPEYAKQINR